MQNVSINSAGTIQLKNGGSGNSALPTMVNGAHGVTRPTLGRAGEETHHVELGKPLTSAAARFLVAMRAQHWKPRLLLGLAPKWEAMALAPLQVRKGRGNNRFAVLLTALALWLSSVFLQVQAATLGVGDTFPQLAKFELEGTLPETQKAKLVLVDFWASWCGPCKASFPVMDELQKKYAKHGLVIVAVNLDDKRTSMERFLAKHPTSLAVVRDATKKLVNRVDINSIPTSFLVDAEGKICAVQNGFRGEETRAKYVQEIEAALQMTLAKAKP